MPSLSAGVQHGGREGVSIARAPCLEAMTFDFSDPNEVLLFWMRIAPQPRRPTHANGVTAQRPAIQPLPQGCMTNEPLQRVCNRGTRRALACCYGVGTGAGGGACGVGSGIVDWWSWS
jgi:hypothetical protein